jgi:hypothetical protein
VKIQKDPLSNLELTGNIAIKFGTVSIDKEESGQRRYWDGRSLGKTLKCTQYRLI